MLIVTGRQAFHRNPFIDFHNVYDSTKHFYRLCRHFRENVYVQTVGHSGSLQGASLNVLLDSTFLGINRYKYNVFQYIVDLHICSQTWLIWRWRILSSVCITNNTFCHSGWISWEGKLQKIMCKLQWHALFDNMSYLVTYSHCSALLRSCRQIFPCLPWDACIDNLNMLLRQFILLFWSCTGYELPMYIAGKMSQELCCMK